MEKLTVVSSQVKQGKRALYQTFTFNDGRTANMFIDSIKDALDLNEKEVLVELEESGKYLMIKKITAAPTEKNIKNPLKLRAKCIKYALELSEFSSVNYTSAASRLVDTLSIATAIEKWIKND